MWIGGRGCSVDWRERVQGSQHRLAAGGCVLNWKDTFVIVGDLKYGVSLSVGHEGAQWCAWANGCRDFKLCRGRIKCLALIGRVIIFSVYFHYLAQSPRNEIAKIGDISP